MAQHKIRQQLSLYLPVEHSTVIESVREVVDPVQFSLIPAHVTLCREHELADIAGIEQRIKHSPIHSVRLTFGKAERFHGHGIIMECVDGTQGFRALREWLLDSCAIGEQKPHLTLAHPRNPIAKGNDLALTQDIPLPFSVILNEITLIRQQNTDPWVTVDSYTLGSKG